MWNSLNYTLCLVSVWFPLHVPIHFTSIYSLHPLPKSNLLKQCNILYLSWGYAFKFWHMVVAYHLILDNFTQCPLFWVFSYCNSSIYWNINKTQALWLFWNLCYVLLCYEAYVGCPLYRNAEEILDEAILGNLVQLLPSELEVLISNFFLQVTAAWSLICLRKCCCSKEPF